MGRKLPSDIDAILLDVGGVLLVPDPVAFREHLAPFGICPSDEECLLAHYAGMLAVDELGSADFVHADLAIARFFGVAEADHEVVADALSQVYRARQWVPVAGAREAVRRLRAAGVSLAVVSNATGTVEAELAAHGICAVSGRSDLGISDVPDVAVVVDSHLVGIEKPDPAIFALALEALDVAPDRCLYVGDSVHFDVNGSTAAGLRPVHLTAATGCRGDHPHYRSLRDFVEAFLDTESTAPIAGADG